MSVILITEPAIFWCLLLSVPRLRTLDIHFLVLTMTLGGM